MGDGIDLLLHFQIERLSDQDYLRWGNYPPLSSQVGRLIAGFVFDDFLGYPRLILGDEEWTADPEASDQLSLGDPWQLVFSEQVSNEILAELPIAQSISLVSFGREPSIFSVDRSSITETVIRSTEHLYFGDSLASFSECMESAQSQAE